MRLIGKEKDYYDELISIFMVEEEELRPKQKELVKHTAKLYVKLEDAEEALLKNGYTHSFKNGTKQVSPHFTAYNKWMDAIRSNLVTMEMFPKSKPVKVEKELNEEESREAQVKLLMKRVK